MRNKNRKKSNPLVKLLVVWFSWVLFVLLVVDSAGKSWFLPKSKTFPWVSRPTLHYIKKSLKQKKTSRKTEEASVFVKDSVRFLFSLVFGVPFHLVFRRRPKILSKRASTVCVRIQYIWYPPGNKCPNLLTKNIQNIFPKLRKTHLKKEH